jgi:hypothetical protein
MALSALIICRKQILVNFKRKHNDQRHCIMMTHPQVYFKQRKLFSYNIKYLSDLQLTRYAEALISLWFFLFPIFLSAAQTKEFFLGGLKKLEQGTHKCGELRGNIHFTTPVACCFLYKAKHLSAPFTVSTLMTPLNNHL